MVRVYNSTPAEEMGLHRGDFITHVDGREVESAREFIARIRSMEPGEEVELDIMRNRDERSLSGELESARTHFRVISSSRSTANSMIPKAKLAASLIVRRSAMAIL